MSAALEVGTASLPLQVRRLTHLEANTEYGRWEFIPSDSKVCLVLPGAWDLNSYLPDRTLAISLLPPFPGVLSLPATPGTLLAWLLPAPASGFPELFVFNEGPLLLKSSLVCLLEGRGFPKGKLWVRPFKSNQEES